MNKQQAKQIEMIKVYINNGMMDNAAKSLSALIRASMSNKAKQELMTVAIETNLVNNNHFVA